jgi:hypothetical protein
MCILSCILCILLNMHIVHIKHIVICMLCILCIFWIKKVIIRVFLVYCHYCLVPHPRAQLFTYHHLQPSPLFSDLSQKAPGKSADSRLVAKDIVPGLSHPQEQEEGVQVWRKLESHTKLVLVHGISRRLQIDTDPARLRSINKSKYAEYAKYAKYDLVSMGPCTLPAPKHRRTRGTACQFLSLYGFLNRSRSLQNHMFSMLSWKATSDIPGGRITTMSWRLVCCNFLGTNGHDETHMSPLCFA